MTLQEQLQAIKAKTAGMITPEVAAAVKQGFEALQENKVLEKALKAGDTAPAFSLTNAGGETIDSKALLSKGPLVILFYRGKW